METAFHLIGVFRYVHSFDVRPMIRRAIGRLRNADADITEVLHGSAIAFAIKILAAGSAFAMNVVIARLLGAEEAGLFFLSYTIILISAAVGRLGLDNTFVRFIAAHHATNEWDQIRGLYLTGIRWSVVASVIIAILLFLSSNFLAAKVFKQAAFADVMRIMAIGIPLMALSTLHANALQGIKKIPQSIIVLSVAAPVAMLVLTFLIYPRVAVTGGALFVGATGLALSLGVYWWLRVPSLTATTPIPVDRASIIASCFPLLWVVILNQTVMWSSQIMLAAWTSSADVAVFNAAQRTAMLTSFILVAVNSIAAPKFSAMYRTGRLEEMRRIAVAATRLMMLFGLAPLALMLALPELILLLFGPEFTAGASALRILSIGQFINLATGSVGFLLSMTGHEKLLRNNVLIAAAVTIALGLILIPSHGIYGAAIATACGIALQNLLCVWQVRRVHGVNTLTIWR